MFQPFTFLLILLAFSFFIQYYLKPKRNQSYLASKFKERGYRVHKRPIIPFISSGVLRIQRDERKGDAMKMYKVELPKYDVSLGNNGGKHEIDIVNPKLIKEFLNSDNLINFHKVKMYQRVLSRVMGNGLVLSEGENWKKKRRIISNIFNYDFVAQLSPRIAEIYEEVLVQSEKESENSREDEVEYNITNFTSDASMRVVLECFLGCESHKILIQDQKLSVFIVQMLNGAVLQLIDPLTFILGIWFAQMGLRKKDKDINRKLKIYREWSKFYIHEKIREFKEKYHNVPDLKPKDLVETLIVQNIKQLAQGNEENMLQEQEILNEFKTFLMVGTDTTSHYLQMIIFYISKHPDIELKIRKEIEEHMKERDFSVTNLKNFKEIEAVMKEVTRIYGPANIVLPRQAVTDCFIDGIPIPKGSFIGYNSFPLHFNPDIYKEPFEFKPQRWMNGQCDKIDPYYHVGFSAGPRSCIGRQLALLQAKIGLIIFLQRYENFSVSKQKLKMQIKFAYVAEQFKIKATRQPRAT